MIDKKGLESLKGEWAVLEQGDDFAYLLPRERLRGVISNFTISFPGGLGISDEYTVMPHGSVTLVLFCHGPELYSFLFGPATKPHRVGDAANKCGVIFIIEFQPAGFFPFTGIAQKELADVIVPFSFIDYDFDQVLRAIFSSSDSADEMLAAFERALVQRIRFPYPDELSRAINTIVLREGVLTSSDISNDVFYSSRHLNRLFNQYIGMSMKAFSRLVKINKSFRLLNDRDNTLEFVSDKLGYYDVSHFVKDFKLVCSVTPQEYRSNMSDFYSEIAKF